MYPSKNIIENAVNSRTYDMVAAEVAAGLVETLQGKAFTVFAPTNAAFVNYQWEQLKHY
jgi:uncharacterized surface protein with fasciclin (FAS1) repeats